MRKLYIILSILLAFALLLGACTTPAEDDTMVEEDDAMAEETMDEEETEEADASEQLTEGESDTEDTAVEVSQYGEAPMLADMVASGDLPPVEERLPSNPMVLEPNPAYDQTIGQYGGEIVTVTDDGGAMGNIKMWLYDPPIR